MLNIQLDDKIIERRFLEELRKRLDQIERRKTLWDFVFPAKQNFYYVSRFNSINAHFGCYPKERFQLMEKDVWSQEPNVQIPDLDQDTFYRAQLVWRAKGYRNKPLKDYVIQPKQTHCFFWHDRKREQFCGCFPLHWFANFEPIIEQPEEVKENPIVLIERFDGQLAFF